MRWPWSKNHEPTYEEKVASEVADAMRKHDLLVLAIEDRLKGRETAS